MAEHRYRPAHYRSQLGGHVPVLVLSPGDSVITECVDAYGIDARGVKVADGDNPLVGPFSVEGAQPGDSLAVHLHSLTPNRELGYSEATLVPSVVDPSFARELPARSRATWRIDTRTRTAQLIDPVADSAPISIELRPMLGCLGVAPPRDQVLWSGTSGRHGGNMDYRGAVAGTTVYLPVFVPGALLYLGDGHAAQGAGELGGAGIEVSFDVHFSVDLRKNAAIEWPRGEDEESIWTIGNARPLEQALQHATTDMLRWMQKDFGYDLRTACILLSQAAEYEVGNVCDPAFSIACKLRKSPELRARRSAVVFELR